MAADGSPRVRAISKLTSSFRVKCWNSATMSANASWNAGTSGLDASWKRRCSPSSSACDISWAMMSLDRQENTVEPGVGGVAVAAVGREIAEQQRLLVGAVVGVVGAQRVRIDAQARHFIGLDPLVAAPAGVLAIVRRPQCAAAERPLEMADRGHGDGIDHLLVKLRIALRRRQTILGEQGLVVEVDRIIDPVRGRIDIHDFEIFANRTRPQRLGGSGLVIPGNRQRRLMHRNGIEALGH